MNFAFGCDENNVLGLAVTIKSLLNTTTHPCTFFILNMGITASDKALLTTSFPDHEVHLLDLSLKELSGMRPTMYLRTQAVYSRLLLDQKLPVHIDRALWLDTDVIVNSDISQVYHADLKGNVIGAVEDVSVNHLTAEHIQHLQKDLGIENPQDYFNSGVLLIDLQKWRAQAIGQKAVAFARQHYHAMHAQDQDVLNAVLKGNWEHLPGKWNQSQYLPNLNENEGIIHLIGKCKPWHADYEYRFKERFFEILDSTAFKGRRPYHLWGLAKYLKMLERKLPTPEIVWGKLGRLTRTRE